MDITFIITDQQKAHEGIVRPFLNFAKALQSKYQLSFLLLNCSKQFSKNIQKNSFHVIVCQNKNSAIEELKLLNPRFIFTDDDLKRLKLASEIKKKINTKTISYIQILYGSHSIADCFDRNSLTLKEKIRFAPLRYVPFSFFSNRYAKFLRTFDLVIANSKVTATFLHSLYNVEVSGIVYPPVDTDIFQPSSPKSKKEIILYLGSHLGDSSEVFVKKLVACIVETGFIVNIFGNPKMAIKLASNGNKSVLFHSNMADSELAQIYSRSKLTVCPQKWEQFGMVPVESLSCGTPVLAFNCMGFQETIPKTVGWLANNESEFLEMLHTALESVELPRQNLRDTATEEFSISVSGRALEALLEKYINPKT